MRDEIRDDAKCAHCGRDFADHNYLADSIDGWQCPVPQYVTGYGHYKGGDPRLFYPDAESCLPEELAAHKAACEAWQRGEAPSPRENHCEGCCGCAPFGVGVYSVAVDTFFEEADVPAWKCEPWEIE